MQIKVGVGLIVGKEDELLRQWRTKHSVLMLFSGKHQAPLHAMGIALNRAGLSSQHWQPGTGDALSE